MSALSQTSTILRSRPGSDPVFGPFGGLLRTTLHNVRLQWFLYRTERRKARAPEPLGEMNAHMLRDIGAPDAMVARAAASFVWGVAISNICSVSVLPKAGEPRRPALGRQCRNAGKSLPGFPSPYGRLGSPRF